MIWETKYEETELIVQAYKRRENGSAQLLLDAFKGFTNKYEEVLIHGVANLSNYSIRKFISLFIDSKDYQKNIHKYKRSPSVVFHACISTDKIKRTFSIFEPNEIRNILSISILELADRYEPIDDNPRFHSYLLKSYHYKVYHNLIPVTQDPLYYTSLEGLIFREDDFITYDVIDEDRYDNKYIQLMTDNDTEVDDNWIAGFSAELFKDLSPVDRKILKLKYIDKLGDKEIGEELGVCRATINRRRIKLEQEIQVGLAKLKLLK